MINLFGFLVWLLTAWAWAIPYNVNFCVDVNVAYDYNSIGGDFWTNNAVDKAARGFQWELEDSGGSPVASGFLDDGGSDVGCTGTIPNLAGPYQFTVHPTAVVLGNTVVHEDASPVTWGVGIIASGDFNLTINYADEAYAQMVLVAYGLVEHPAGNTGETFTIRHTTGAVSASEVYINLQDSTTDKYLIAHELGHMVTLKRSGGIAFVVPCGCAGSCDGGDNISRKFQAQAAREGIGWWYANVTWNDKAEADCEWTTNQQLNFDLDGFIEYSFGDAVPCWGDPDTTAPDYTDGEDWLSDVVAAGAGGCSGGTTNRGTEYDWVHYLWGLYAWGSDNTADNGNELTAAEVVDLWVESDPASWDTFGFTGSTTDDPWPRWDAGADTLGADHDAAHDYHKGAIDH